MTLNRRRTAGPAVIASIAILTSTFLTATPANADSSCATGTVCFWDYNNYQDPKWTYGITVGVWHDFSSAYKNRVSSVRNRTGYAVRIADGSGGSGTRKCIGSGASHDVNYLSGLGFDNRADSVSIGPDRTCG